jgi:hypothetical protein
MLGRGLQLAALGIEKTKAQGGCQSDAAKDLGSDEKGRMPPQRIRCGNKRQPQTPVVTGSLR